MRLLVSGASRTVARLAPSCGDVLGVLLNPNSGNSVAAARATGLPWAADNAAFTGFEPARFRRFLRRVALAPGCLFLTVPDVVGDARATLARFDDWRSECYEACQPLAFVGQDGAEDLDVPWGEFDAWFVGGTDDWKLCQSSADLAAEAKRRGLWLHCGRVNSLRRLRAAYDMGCDSVDGTSMSNWADTYLPRYVSFVRSLVSQPVLFGEG